MILRRVLVAISLLNLTESQDLFSKFMPNIKHSFRHKHPNQVPYEFVPLYMKKGPEPLSDYMVNHFKPKHMAKRFQNPFHRTKRQVADDNQFKDLLDSFGGTTEADEDSDESVVTPNPKSGFYYLVDWNTFIVVDDQNGRRVNAHIRPKFGDPKRFFSISVP